MKLLKSFKCYQKIRNLKFQISNSTLTMSIQVHQQIYKKSRGMRKDRQTEDNKHTIQHSEAMSSKYNNQPNSQMEEVLCSVSAKTANQRKKLMSELRKVCPGVSNPDRIQQRIGRATNNWFAMNWENLMPYLSFLLKIEDNQQHEINEREPEQHQHQHQHQQQQQQQQQQQPVVVDDQFHIDLVDGDRLFFCEDNEFIEFDW